MAGKPELPPKLRSGPPLEARAFTIVNAEAELFNALQEREALSVQAPAAVFILGAPRTGSTLIYQAVCSWFDLPYIANITNSYFAEMPIVGLALQKAIPTKIEYESHFGKTAGLFQPSEGSAVMSRWFGGGHPSAIVSNTILPGAETHFLLTLRAAFSLFGAPLVIKNAWNCFRVTYLAQALPKSRFIWIRRDIAEAAKSDLHARYKTKGAANIWNSATPANIDDLMRLTPPIQVIENQRAFNDAIEAALKLLAPNRACTIWYEDLLKAPAAIAGEIGRFLGRSAIGDERVAVMRQTGSWSLSVSEEKEMVSYLAANAADLAAHRYRSCRTGASWN